jgi:hypothetical protein
MLILVQLEAIRNEALIIYKTDYLIHLLKRMQFDLHNLGLVP